MKKIKKSFVIVFIAILLFGNIMPALGFSGSGNANWTGGQYDTMFRTTESIKYDRGILIRKLTNVDTGEKLMVFCAEHTEDFVVGTVNNGDYYVAKDETLRKACKVAYLGWYSKYKDSIYDISVENDKYYEVRKDYAFTQQYIWEILGQSKATFIDADIQSKYNSFKSEINKKIENMKLKPSFSGNTITLEVGKSTTLQDTNKVLSEYSSIDKEIDKVKFKHNKGENTLTISVLEDCNIEKMNISESNMQEIGLIKEETKENNTSIYFEFKEGVQNQLYSMHYNEPVTMSLNLKIEALGKLELTKLDTENNLIDGAIFNIKGDNYNKDVKVTNGKIVVENLKSGTYEITEKTAPYGYLLNTKTYLVEVNANKTAKQAIVNIEPTGNIEIIKKNEQGDLLENAIFKISADEDIKNIAGTKVYYKKGQEVSQITSNNKGIASIKNLPLGKYIVEEIKAPTGYLNDNIKYNVNLSYKGQTEKIVTESLEKVNKEPTGEIKVYKTDNFNNKLQGAEITLYAKEDIKNSSKTKTWYKKGEMVQKKTTNSEGVAIFSDIHLGKYYVQETKAPEGYLINENEFEAFLEYKNQETKIIYLEINGIVNEEPRGSISIVKKDAEGADKQGDASLKGATYKLYANEDIFNKLKTTKFYSKGDLVATRITDEYGKTEDIKNLPLGKYIVKEEIASEGYLVDKNEYQVELKYKNQNEKIISEIVTSKEQVKKMQVHIFKSGIKMNTGLVQGIEGVEFTIKLNSDVENALDKGYTYEEIWNGIDKYGREVKVNSDRAQEAQKIAPSYEIITTDSEGNGFTKNKLPYGKYIVKETKTPTDFKTAEDFTFSITEDESEIEEIPKKMKYFIVNDEPLETYIRIIKKDADTKKTVSLSSATFEIKSVNDIINQETGDVLFKKGEPISQKIGSNVYTSFTTNADNMVIVDNSYSSSSDEKGMVVSPLTLPVGLYEINEIKTPQGYLKLNENILFEIKNVKDYDINENGDFIRDIIIENNKPTGTLVINKKVNMQENVDKSLIDISDLSGIVFKLSAKENIIDSADGSIIYEKGKEIQIFNLDKEGNYKIENLPLGLYELQEIKTLDGLILDETKYEIRFY